MSKKLIEKLRAENQALEARIAPLKAFKDCADSQLNLQHLQRVTAERDAAVKKVEEVLGLINTPMLHDFINGVTIEAAHQREKWGTGHDENKTPADWALLFQYILGKQANAVFSGDKNKYLHHLITIAAIAFNAHRCALGTKAATDG